MWEIQLTSEIPLENATEDPYWKMTLEIHGDL